MKPKPTHPPILSGVFGRIRENSAFQVNRFCYNHSRSWNGKHWKTWTAIRQCEKACVLIVMSMYSHCMFMYDYPDWRFSVLLPQLQGKCQGKTRKDGARPTLFQISVLFYVLFVLCCSVYFCVVLCIVCFVSFSVLFVCICVMNYCHRVANQMQLNISATQLQLNISATQLQLNISATQLQLNISTTKLQLNTSYHYQYNDSVGYGLDGPAFESWQG